MVFLQLNLHYCFQRKVKQKKNFQQRREKACCVVPLFSILLFLIVWVRALVYSIVCAWIYSIYTVKRKMCYTYVDVVNGNKFFILLYFILVVFVCKTTFLNTFFFLFGACYRFFFFFPGFPLIKKPKASLSHHTT